VAGKDWESELIAALLVHETMLTLETTQGTQTKALENYLADKLENTIITAITFARGGKSALERVARTPKDTAIVAVAGRVGDGISRFAFTGLAPTPILLSPAKLTSLTPPADFRGSAAYRLDIAHTLSTRVQNTLEKQS
jgi:CO/xanthine dehydrogenase FAD-binding subunit